MSYLKRLVLTAVALSSVAPLVGCQPGAVPALRPESESASGPPDAKRLESLWADLADADARKGYAALCQMAAHPAESVPFLQAHLHPAESTDPRRVAVLIAALDDDQFDARSKAKMELENIGDPAEPAMRKALDGTPSDEARQALRQILAKLEGPVTDAEVLRSVRAVEVLERVADPEAKHVLQILAKGAPAARLTREARASLERLEKTGDTNP